jgi:hypothetical protein
VGGGGKTIGRYGTVPYFFAQNSRKQGQDCDFQEKVAQVCRFRM